MPLGTALPYGLRDIKITPYTDAGATTLAAASIDLPNSRTLSFSEAEEFEELRGDDKVVTTRGKGAAVNWSLEAGGLSFPAVKAMVGGEVVASGTADTEVNTFTKKATDSRPYFQIEGQIISDSGGDVHCVIPRCRATGDFKGDFADGSFFLTGLDGVGLPSMIVGKEDVLYVLTQNAAAKAITP